MSNNESGFTEDELNKILSGEGLDEIVDGDTVSEDDPAPAPTDNGENPKSEGGEGEGGKGEAEGGKPEPANLKTEQPNEDDLNAENAVILSKDGKYQIPFEKLTEARERFKQAKEESDTTKSELQRLRSEYEALKAKAVTQLAESQEGGAQEGNLSESDIEGLLGDFSEQAIAAGVKKLVDLEVKKVLEPMKQRETLTAQQAHDDAINNAHPDAGEIYESVQFAEWFQSHNSIVQQAYSQVLQSGTAQQVIELFNDFKKSSASPTQEAQKTDAASVKEAAKKAVADLKVPVPNSLTDLTGGKNKAGSREEEMAEMSGLQLVNSLESMSQEQINNFLNNL